MLLDVMTDAINIKESSPFLEVDQVIEEEALPPGFEVVESDDESDQEDELGWFREAIDDIPPFHYLPPPAEAQQHSIPEQDETFEEESPEERAFRLTGVDRI